MHFDRYKKAGQSEIPINESMDSIQLEYDRIRILSQRASNKVLKFLDGAISDHKMLVSYHYCNSRQELTAIDPLLHYDLYYNSLQRKMEEVDLVVLRDFMNQFFCEKLTSSESPEEKLGNLIVSIDLILFFKYISHCCRNCIIPYKVIPYVGTNIWEKHCGIEKNEVFERINKVFDGNEDNQIR